MSASGQNLLERLSFSHSLELLKLEDPLQRAFYEVECIRGGWSVRELRRQIVSLYCERSGLSENKEKLAALTRSTAEVRKTELAVRDPYVFEFLGLKPREVMSESAPGRLPPREAPGLPAGAGAWVLQCGLCGVHPS